MKKFLTMLLALVMALSLVACGQTEQPDADKDAEGTSTDPFYIWTWNTDYQKILDEVLPKYLSEEQVSRIQIVNVGDSNIYQDKIDAILADPSNEQYPDIMLLEVGYVQKYVQSGQLMKAADLGITAEDMSNMYDYNLKLGSDANGDAYALFWQATPGCWQIRTDLAEKYMGTTDPAELQEKLSTWDKVIEVSKSVNEQSGGKVKLLSGADDLKYVFCNGARTSAWYDADDNIVIDDAVKTYFELSKKLDGLTFDTKMWSTDWAALKDGDVMLLENTRFEKGETKNDPELSKALASLADVFVNDAFGTAHRAHSSTAGVADYLPAVSGFLVQKEVSIMGKALSDPERPFVAVLGGAKVSDKLNVINNLLEKVDTLIIGGGMAYTFLAAKGYAVGKSLLDESKIDYCKDMMAKAEAKGVKLLLPVDVVVADSFPDPIDGPIDVTTVDAAAIPADKEGLDIGEKTCALFASAVKDAKTVVWNGPMGVFENPTLAKGTIAMAQALADSSATTIVGGGDSAAACEQLGFADKITHISTGGGASLEFLEGLELPGIACLEDK